MPKDNLFGSFSRGFIDVKHVIDDAEQSVECRLDSISAIERCIAMKDFLQNLCIGYQSFAIIDQFFQQSLSIALMRVRGTH